MMNAMATDGYSIFGEQMSTDELLKWLRGMGLNDEDYEVLKTDMYEDLGIGGDGQFLLQKLMLKMMPHCSCPPDVEGEGTPTTTPNTGAAQAYVSCQKLWHDREVLHVYFLNSSILESWKSGRGKSRVFMSTAMILEWANTWQTSDAIPMFVECSSASEADVRVLFSDTAGSWSMVGTEAHKVKDNKKPTMVLNLKRLPQDFQRYLVIHEFGHALGLEHEHQRSDFWEVVEKFVDVEKMGNDERTGDYSSKKGKAAFGKDWLKKKEPGEVSMSEYDADSIMHYWFDVDWLKNPQHRQRRGLDRDSDLTPTEKFYLRGIHKRNNDYARDPSATDFKYLEDAYTVS